MLMVRTLTTWVLFISFTTVWGHQQKEAYTTIKPNSNSGKTEVIHRFYLHDAEHGFSGKLGESIVFSVDESAQSKFADYVVESFQLKIDNGKEAVALETVGFEVEGRYIWVYQETSQKLPCQVVVKMDALHDVWEKHINQVNFEWPEGIKSVRLTSNEANKAISIYQCD